MLSRLALLCLLLPGCASPLVAGADAGPGAVDATSQVPGHDAADMDASVAPDASSLDAAGPSDAAASGDASAPAARLVFVGDFEAPGDFTPGSTYSQFSENVDTCEHDQTCTTDSLAIVTTPVRRGTRALRVTLRSSDVQDTSGTRAELQTGSHYETTLEEDYWYGWSVFVPPDWVGGEDQKVVHQWHTGGGNPGGSPIIGLRIRRGSWQLTREFEEGSAIELWNGGPVARGAWTDWVLHVRWSPRSTGHFTAWKDGQVVHQEDGPNMNAGTTSGGHYQKLGMYGTFPGTITERVLYYDEVRVAKGPDGYALVAP